MIVNLIRPHQSNMKTACMCEVIDKEILKISAGTVMGTGDLVDVIIVFVKDVKFVKFYAI